MPTAGIRRVIAFSLEVAHGQAPVPPQFAIWTRRLNWLELEDASGPVAWACQHPMLLAIGERYGAVNQLRVFDMAVGKGQQFAGVSTAGVAGSNPASTTK